MTIADKRGPGRRPRAVSGGNDEKMVGATADKRTEGNVAIEGGQPCSLLLGEAEQVDIRELPVCDRQRRTEDRCVSKGNAVRPERMIATLAEGAQTLDHLGRPLRRGRVGWI